MAKLAKALQRNENSNFQVASTPDSIGSPANTALSIIDVLFPGIGHMYPDKQTI